MTSEESIVRCKDCKYYKTYYMGFESKPIITNICLWFLMMNFDSNNYCSKGERKL